MTAFDPGELERLTGLSGADLQPLLESYLKNQSAIEAQLRAMLDPRAVDTSELEVLAHRLKSAARAVGARSLADISEALEVAAAANVATEGSIVAVIDGIEHVKSELGVYLPSLDQATTDPTAKETTAG